MTGVIQWICPECLLIDQYIFQDNCIHCGFECSKDDFIKLKLLDFLNYDLELQKPKKQNQNKVIKKNDSKWWWSINLPYFNFYISPFGLPDLFLCRISKFKMKTLFTKSQKNKKKILY